MKPNKCILSLAILLALSCTAFAQKQTFGVVSFNVPKGWQKTQNDDMLQLSVTDNKTGAYGIALVTKLSGAEGTASENFTNHWNILVKGSVQVNGEPIMQQPTQLNGWEIVSGTASYSDAKNTGTATLLTATGGGQTVSVVLMNNTSQYQNELLLFKNSLTLAKVQSTATGNNASSSSNKKSNSSVAGLWVIRQRESRGAGKYSTYTGGYMRKEYQFNKDGTYLFRIKNWLAASETIYFISESGTWSVNDDQLTVTPKKGKGGWWNKDKVTNNVDKWGSFKQAADYKIQSITYRFEIKEDPNYGNSIILYANKPTERDGGQFNEPPYRFSYTTPGDPHPWIDSPPGWKD